MDVTLDFGTLLVVNAFIAALSAIVMAVAAVARRSRGCPWWVAGAAISAVGIMLVLLINSDGATPRLQTLSALTFATTAALYWAGARVFAGRPLSYPVLVAGVVVVVGIAVVERFTNLSGSLLQTGIFLSALYLLAAGAEMVLARARLAARWPLAVLLFFHGAFFAFGAIAALIEGAAGLGPGGLISWRVIISFEAIIFQIGITAFVIAFARERAEARQRERAEVDMLTGVATRRAFLERARPLLDDIQPEGPPLALIVFDLDRFKSVNDSHGHVTGDRVIARFGGTLRGLSRGADVVGRLGGEEFALLLPATALPEALAVAERIRAAFETEGQVVDGLSINATVSAGVALAEPGSTIEALVTACDESLYAAKARGRNQVVTAMGRAQTPVDLRTMAVPA